MNKTLLICLTGIFSVAGFSQNIDKEYSLAEVRSSDQFEYELYTYNSDLLLKATDILLDNETQVRDTLSYDNSNNIIKLDTHQLLNDVWTHVSYVEYTYDANGNRLSRSNYNSFGGSTFELGGVYNYFYENNKLTSRELFMGGTNLVETCTYTYNDSDQIVQELALENWNSTSWENSWKIDYEYNNDGTLQSSISAYWNDISWAPVGTNSFYYDDNKNCIKWEYVTGNRVVNKNEYEYNLDYTVDQLVLPINPEVQSDPKSLVEMNNMVTLRHWYTQNDLGELGYVCDFIYTYDYIGTTGTPDAAFIGDNIGIYPNPSAESITVFSRTNDIQGIEIINTTGQSVLKVSNENKKEMNLDVSSLSSGIYYVRMLTSKGMITQKLVKE